MNELLVLIRQARDKNRDAKEPLVTRAKMQIIDIARELLPGEALEWAVENKIFYLTKKEKQIRIHLTGVTPKQMSLEQLSPEMAEEILNFLNAVRDQQILPRIF